LSALTPVSTQTGVPVAQVSAPLWQRLDVGTQGPPSLQATQRPALLQTLPISHSAPAGLLPPATQTCVPVLHEYVPVLQRSVG
jgi:hypothetical protein